MKIDLKEIYAGLKAYRAERGLTAENQKSGYIVNIMEELGEYATAIRNYVKIKNGEQAFKMTTTKMKLADDIFCEVVERKALCLADAEHEIIDAICDIAVLTINAGADIPCHLKHTNLNDLWIPGDFARLMSDCGALAELFGYECECGDEITKLNCELANNFNNVLVNCSQICEEFGFNFEVAMIETIKEISSRTGKYDESAKKWVKDESDEAKSKWYKANFEKARILK